MKNFILLNIRKIRVKWIRYDLKQGSMLMDITEGKILRYADRKEDKGRLDEHRKDTATQN